MGGAVKGKQHFALLSDGWHGRDHNFGRYPPVLVDLGKKIMKINCNPLKASAAEQESRRVRARVFSSVFPDVINAIQSDRR